MREDDAGVRLALEPTERLAAVSPRRRSRTRRILIGLIGVVLALILLAAAGIYLLTERLGNNVARVPDVFAGLDGTVRPVEQSGTTFLLVGTDSRSAEPTTGTNAEPGVQPGSQRSDVIMVAWLADDGTSASVTSIPRDSWVDIPGRGKNKINAAYAFGGAPLLIETAEQLTGIRIDHFAVIDFAGFEEMVDSVGGIDVRVARQTGHEDVVFHEGLNHLDGAKALHYVRERYDLPAGDLDRARRQQNVLRALLGKAGDSLADPAGLYHLVDATTRTVSVDDTLSNGGLRDLALRARGLRAAGVSFVSVPVSGLGTQGPQSVVYLDEALGRQLWDAVRAGTVAEYLANHPDQALPAVPA